MADTENSSVKATVRTFDVLEAFAEVGEPMTLTEIADRVDVPLSSCHALMRTLHARGYIYQLDRRRLFYPTKRLYEVASEIARHDPILAMLLPALKALMHETRETVILGKLSGREVIYLEVIEGPQTIRYSAQPGERKPLHSSAAGKALLGQLTEKEYTKLMGRLELKQMTEATIVDREKLKEDVNAGRERGYFVTNGENVADVKAVAIAAKIAGEKFAIAVAGPASRLQSADAKIAAAIRTSISTVREVENDNI